MKPALKVEVNPKAGPVGLTLVTTEDGVFGLPAEAAEDVLGMLALVMDDYTTTRYNYFPADVMPLVRKMGGGEWRTVYTFDAKTFGEVVH